MSLPLSRRELLGAIPGFAALVVGRGSWVFGHGSWVAGPGLDAPDLERLKSWVSEIRSEGLSKAPRPIGSAAIRAGELAAGTPYKPGTLEQYLLTEGPLDPEPLTCSLTQFDCVTLVESCLGVARVAARYGAPTWARFEAEIERMRYRGGQRKGYSSRLHYFSEWIRDGERRGLCRSLGQELGGEPDRRPLRFMSEHASAYPAMKDAAVVEQIKAMEQRLDDQPRWVVPTDKIESVSDRIQSGDVLAFATGIPGLDVTHAAFGYRGKDGVLRVLHAPLSGGVVEITKSTLPEYVKAIRRATGVLVARPL